jgi:N-acetylglutamate synthase-like GNAT family acetyltransferase
LFRLADSKDIDAVHELLVAESRLGRFDQRLAQEPYSAALRKNLNHIRRKGRRLDEELAAQLLVWEADGAVAGFVVNSAILPGLGNEILMLAVMPEFRGRGEGQKMKTELLAQLHPRVDVFARCPPGAKLYVEMLMRRGFVPLDTADKGVRILKLPKPGSVPVEQTDPYQHLEPFVQIAVK